MKYATLDQLKDKHIGKMGSEKREKYEFDLKLDILGEMIKKTRKERNLTQEDLGKLIGVKKAQISRLEKSANNVTVGTILKVFTALKTNIKLNIEFIDNEFQAALRGSK